MNPRICAALIAYPSLAPKFLDIYSNLVKKIEDALGEYNRDIDELLDQNKPI